MKKTISFIIISSFCFTSFSQNNKPATIIANPNEEVILPTYKEGELGLAKPAVAKYEDALNNIKGFWKYSKTEFENKQKYIKNEVRTHTVKKFDPEVFNKIEDNNKNTSTPTPPTVMGMNESNPVDPKKEMLDGLNTEDKPLINIIEMFDPKYQYMFMKKSDSTGNYKVISNQDGAYTELTIWDIVYTISNKKGVPTLEFSNTRSKETPVSFYVFRASEKELILADLKRRVVHYFVKQN